ncbi:PhzF family phenazine biosynthesis protein [Proteiniborus sp. MB09-C3]|uniref:PhzF family phenazine biosynthesis protein n=1 Tax=Proteiniborus sp. MB09-C3 TaxID=3050072 RepID=UPI0025538C91|nr:PhzF family phenazine biosynthesis protein [Proteiniborus sp. MB09-C3]WIV12587.1 PhzF family phenazine biosynthesis protein [Proteiniborus sp. MB09-C3]
MEAIIYQVDAFTDKPFGGNPAGVVPDAKNLSEQDMQNIANEMNLPETAFIKKIAKDCFEVRFFTPECEVDLCGHATIASFYVLGKKGYIRPEGRTKVQITQKTKIGLLPVELYFENDEIFQVLMHQGTPEAFGKIDNIEEISEILGIGKEQIGIKDFELKPEIISTGLKDIIVPVKDEEVLKSLKIDFKKMDSYCAKKDSVGMHIFALDNSNESTVYCRNFAPSVGIYEEAATGTANGALIYYMKRNNILKSDEIIALQGKYMNRPSEILCKICDYDNKSVVKVGGKAVIIIEGVIKC